METKLKLITAAAADTVTLTEAKAHLRVDFSTDDTLITTLIKVATEYCETRLARALITQTWEQYLNQFPIDSNIFEVKLPILQTLTSIKYYDSANVLQTWNASNYEVDAISEPAKVRLAAGKSFPGTYDRLNAVIIKFNAGYGTASTNIPETIRQAIKLLISHFYENREGINTLGQYVNLPIPKAVDLLLNSFSVRQQF